MSDEWTVGDDLPLIEDGVYTATCVRVEDAHSDLFDKDQLVLIFRIEEEPYSGQELWRYVSAPNGAVRPKMALYPIAEALMGVKLSDYSGTISRTDLTGKTCQVVVKSYAKQDGTMVNKVAEVLRIKASAKLPEKEAVVKQGTKTVQELALDLFESSRAAKTNEELETLCAELGIDFAYDPEGRVVIPELNTSQALNLKKSLS